jgi:hypothetical protein
MPEVTNEPESAPPTKAAVGHCEAFLEYQEPLLHSVSVQPVEKVAKKWDSRVVAWSKACRRLQIPMPPRGFWARVSAWSADAPTAPTPNRRY